MFALPLFALVCIAGLTMSTDAALADYENGSTAYPWQYQDYANAYDVIEWELGVPLEIQKNGGGDPDFLKLRFLNINELVTVTVNQSNDQAHVHYWVSDPNFFPICHYVFAPPDDPNFFLQFGVTVPGFYYIHTGQALGDTFINMTIERVAVSPPIPEKDSNNAPSDMVLLTAGQTHSENAGLPWDASDYFYLHITPNAQFNKYLTIELEVEEANTIQWEMYNPTGIQRPSTVYTSDTIRFGTKLLKDYVITVKNDYIIRIWMQDGFGQYNLTMSIMSYENDNDNSIGEATPVTDNSEESGDVNLSFDRDDYYEIYLDEGEPLWVVLTPINGPADLYIFDDRENQKRASRSSGLDVERINSWKPDDSGFYYIVVESVYESPDWEAPPTVDYTLEVWINYRPNVVSPLPPGVKNKHIDEDTPDSDYDVTILFEDLDGDELVFALDMSSYDNTSIDIQLGVDNKLIIVPAADASDFKVQIVFNATDPHGLMINFSTWIWVDPINDAPYVDEEQVPDEMTMNEDKVVSGRNVTKPFRDVDDDFSTWTFTITTTDNIMVQMDDDWLVTLTPMVENWAGYETFTVTCTDKGGLTAEIVYTIKMVEINDPPEIINYIAAFTMDEESTVTIEMEDDVAGWYFHDVEGENMTYDFDLNGSLTVVVTGSLITITGQLDFVGTETDLVIWAIDERKGKSLNLTVFVQVLGTNDPHDLDLIIATANVQENEGVTFEQGVYYSFFDKDSIAFDMTWDWYLDDEEVPSEQISARYDYEYIPPITADKDRTVIVRLEVSDADWSKEVSWTVFVTNLNVAPSELVVTTGANKTEYLHGEAISFSATASDLDGDDLTYTWFLDLLEEVGTGPNLNLKDVDSGPHKVTVSVKDSSGTETTEDFDFTVTKESVDDDDSPGFNFAYVVLALIGAVSIMVIVRRR